MDNVLKYKDYIGTVNYSAEDEVFYGKLFGINDLITFEGDSVPNLKIAFQEAVEDYLISCKHQNKEPEKSYKGSFNVRISSELHKDAAILAQQNKVTLNEFVKAAINYYVKHPDLFKLIQQNH